MGKCYGEILRVWEMLWKNDVHQGLFHLLQNIPVSKYSQNLKGTPLQ